MENHSFLPHVNKNIQKILIEGNHRNRIKRETERAQSGLPCIQSIMFKSWRPKWFNEHHQE